jgi:hypothetical protein
MVLPSLLVSAACLVRRALVRAVAVEFNKFTRRLQRAAGSV